MYIESKEVIYQSSFILGTDTTKCFNKLRQGQFSSPYQGIVQEPLANALDACRDDAPVEIQLEKFKGFATLTFQDNGQGLTVENLMALHVIGRSSKRGVNTQKIGRFGTGLIGAFHSELAVFKAEIIACLGGDGGLPVKITIICFPEEQRIPEWQYEILENSQPVTGLKISFYFPLKVVKRIKHAIEGLIKRVAMPIRWNGKLKNWQPEQLRMHKSDVIVTVGNTESVKVHYALHESSLGEGQDLHLRGMPIIVKSGCELLENMGINYDLPNNFNIPWVNSSVESAVVFSRIGEPTLSRDDFCHDADWQSICTTIKEARMVAITQFITPYRYGAYSERAKSLVWANIWTCRAMIIAFLKGEALPSTHATAFVTALCSFPAFETLTRQSISINDILTSDAPNVTYAAASSLDAANGASVTYTGSYVIRNNNPHTWTFGMHLHHIAEDLLGPILTGLGRHLIVLDSRLRNDHKRLNELIDKGILRKNHYEYSLATPNTAAKQFLDRLKVELNKPWFGKALGKDYTKCRIGIFGVNIVCKTTDTGHVIAMLIEGKTTIDEMLVAINLESPFFMSLANMDNEHAIYAFLPVLVHELSHRTGYSHNDPHSDEHSLRFYHNLFRLGDRVISACVDNLLNGDNGEDGEAFSDQREGIIVV